MKYTITSANVNLSNNYINTGPVKTPNTKTLTLDLSIDIYDPKFNASSIEDIKNFLKDTGLPEWATPEIVMPLLQKEYPEKFL